MIFAADLGDPEGPVSLADGSWLVVEMRHDRGCVTQISPDGRSRRVIARTGRPNGLAVDGRGCIWVAESQVPALLRLTLDGKVETFATGCDGEPFIFPNDLAFGPDGALYMTDSGITIGDFAPGGRIRADWASAMPDGRVYRIDTRSGEVRKLDSGLRFTNGIAFGPDGSLYVNETLTGMVYRYGWGRGELPGPRENLANVVDWSLPRSYRGPDGMKFGADGRLFVTVYGQQEVAVVSPDGAVVDRIRTDGRNPTNCAFGPGGERRLYVTEVERGTLEVLEVGTDGLPLYTGNP
ncbi:MAG: SMP-30/gluconolactonase/LRE family protein [Anaerolineae bacterium]|nr:SMP-30/gluconolactonase/LRE family protein [Anaerolineae bacterium]